MPTTPFRSRRRRPAAVAALAALLSLAGGLLPGASSPVQGAGLGLNLRGPAQARTKAKELTQAAFTAHERGDAARALALLDEAEALYPNQADSYNLRGAVHLRRGDYARAASAFARAAALDPDLWAAKFNLADIPFKQKNYAQARVLFDRLVDGTDRYKTSARWELALYKAGLCCLLAGDEAGATRRLVRLTAPGAAPSAASLHAQAALAFAKRDAATGNRLVLAAQTACKPAANALYLPSLAAAGWVTPAFGPPGSAVAANGRTPGGGSRLTYLPGNLPISEPELPGGGGGMFAGNALLGIGNGRPVPAPTPLVLPAARPLAEPAPIPEEMPAPVAAASVPGVTGPLLPGSPAPAAAEPAPTPTVDLSPAVPTPAAPAVGSAAPKS